MPLNTLFWGNVTDIYNSFHFTFYVLKRTQLVLQLADDRDSRPGHTPAPRDDNACLNICMKEQKVYYSSITKYLLKMLLCFLCRNSLIIRAHHDGFSTKQITQHVFSNHHIAIRLVLFWPYSQLSSVATKQNNYCRDLDLR